MGVRSFQGTMLAAKARELECGLNGEMQYCTTLRARWQAWADRKEGSEDINRSSFLEDGLVESNVRMLARYGIFLRDRRFELCNAIVDLIMMDAVEGKLKKKVSGPIGHYKFKRKTTEILGDGHDSLLEFSTFSPLFNEIREEMRAIESIDTNPDWTSPRTWKCKSKALKRFNITSCKLADYARTDITRIKQDVITTYQYAEWKGESSLTLEAPKTALDWTRKTTAWTAPQFEFDLPPMRIDTREYEESIKKEMVNMRIDGIRQSNWNEERNLRDILYGDEDESNEIIGGLDRNGELFNRLDKLFPIKAQSKDEREAWFRCEDRLELIRRYFEDKGCQFFTAVDGGKITVENNGKNHGAKTVVLWAPFMADDENFEDIIDKWQDRRAVLFLVRAGCVPNKIGTETTNCGHTEMGALNLDLDLLRPEDPCIHILDSNAIAFTARSIRDDQTPAMRRRVRGTGVAAGKGDLERLRITIDSWRSKGEGSDERAPWNKRQRENMENNCKQINKWKAPRWPDNYRDDSEKHPIFIVDSHQMQDNGKSSGRYKAMTPCLAFVTANEIADKVCSNILGGVEGGNLMLNTIEPHPDVSHPPSTLRFYFSHMGKTLNGDTPIRTESLVRETLWLAAPKTQEQGRLLRMLAKTNLTAEIIGRKGSYSKLC
jgi:hypothetical protein